jgi:hypothetical protein
MEPDELAASGDILGLASLAISAEVIGIRFPRDTGSKWVLGILALAIAYGHWEWRTRPPKDGEVAQTNQYRTYALATAIGQILLTPWLAWYGTGGWEGPGGLTVILVFGYSQWVRRLYKVAKEELILRD